MNGHNKLVLHYTWLEILAKDKHSSLLAPFVSYDENEVLWKKKCCEYGPRSRIHKTFIFNATCTNKLVFNYTKQKYLAEDKHSSLLVPFVSYSKNEVM
jgi:hypothetical protein